MESDRQQNEPKLPNDTAIIGVWAYSANASLSKPHVVLAALLNSFVASENVM